MPVVIRPHLASDAPASLEVFYASIRITAAADYSSEQIEVWASPETNVDDWSAKRQARTTIVAVIDGDVVGFADVDREGYIDMLFVHPSHGRCGVATVLLNWVLEEAARSGAPSLTTHASITARPFFEANDFVVVEERHPITRGVILQNYAMHPPI